MFFVEILALKSRLNFLFLQYMGNISYVLYLVHWPVITFYTKLNFISSLQLYGEFTIIWKEGWIYGCMVENPDGWMN